MFIKEPLGDTIENRLLFVSQLHVQGPDGHPRGVNPVILALSAHFLHVAFPFPVAQLSFCGYPARGACPFLLAQWFCSLDASSADSKGNATCLIEADIRHEASHRVGDHLVGFDSCYQICNPSASVNYIVCFFNKVLPDFGMKSKQQVLCLPLFPTFEGSRKVGDP
jgi:hypothetical protein